MSTWLGLGTLFLVKRQSRCGCKGIFKGMTKIQINRSLVKQMMLNNVSEDLI